MDSRFDAFAKLVSSSALRRDVFRGLGSLAIGALGIHALTGVENDAEARRKNKKNNRCKNCKQKCRRKNRRKNNKNRRNCNNKCNNKCP